MWLTLKNTKTVQYGEKKLCLPVPDWGAEEPINPARLVKLYLSTTAHRPLDDPLFGYPETTPGHKNGQMVPPNTRGPGQAAEESAAGCGRGPFQVRRTLAQTGRSNLRL